MVLLTAWIARRRQFPKDQPFAWDRLWTEFKGAVWALLMPVLILVGFRMGVFTATEIAGVAAAYSLIVGVFIYRTLRWSHLPKILLSTAKETAVILLIVAAASPFSWILGIEQAPQLISEALTGGDRQPVGHPDAAERGAAGARLLHGDARDHDHPGADPDSRC